MEDTANVRVKLADFILFYWIIITDVFTKK